MRNRFRITAKQCVDDRAQWVWSILDEDGGIVCDGYEGSEEEAMDKARMVRDDHESNLSNDERI
jgi:hypothetical protein